MSWNFAKISPKSHRVRVTLVVSLVFGAITAILFGFASIYNSNERRRIADVQLDTALHSILADIVYDTPAEYLQILRKNPRGLSGAVFDADGSLIVKDGSIPLIKTTGKGIANMGGVLVNYVSGTANGKTAVVADTWQDVVDADLRLNIELISVWFPLTCLVALVTWVTITRTFRPLLAMADEAGRLSAEDLNSRLAVPHDQEFGELAKRLNAFLDRLEHNVHVQEQFVQDAAHELRTPLTILRGQTETALLRERKPEDYVRILHTTLDESVRMSELVESLLVSSRTALSKAAVQEMAVVVQDSVDRWQGRFSQANVKLKSRIQSAKAPINPREIESVLDNLLANALRHSPEGSTTTVELTSKNGVVQLAVGDHGSGVSDELKDKIFERFFRTDEARNRKSGGFGIGLAICRRIIQERGGSIWVEDNVPNGARFVASWGAKS